MNFFLQIRVISCIICRPTTNQAPSRYRFGGRADPILEHQDIDLETNWEKNPCGTKPSTKWRYNGQGSVGDGSILATSSGGDLSRPGTKYFTSVGKAANLAIKPNCSIMSKMSSLTRPCWMNLEKTPSTSSMLRTPLDSTSGQYLDCTGS